MEVQHIFAGKNYRVFGFPCRIQHFFNVFGPPDAEIGSKLFRHVSSGVRAGQQRLNVRLRFLQCRPPPAPPEHLLVYPGRVPDFRLLQFNAVVLNLTITFSGSPFFIRPSGGFLFGGDDRIILGPSSRILRFVKQLLRPPGYGGVVNAAEVFKTALEQSFLPVGNSRVIAELFIKYRSLP